jgi:uncharacterized protein YjbI with pentapeptide repeats
VTSNARARAACSLIVAALAAALLSAVASPALGAVTCPTVATSGAVTPPPSAGVDWAGCDLTGAYLPNADLAGANLDGATLKGADFVNANLAQAALDAATASFASFAGATLDGADLSSATLTDASFQQASLRGASLDSVSAWGAGFGWASLRDASLQNADLDAASFQGANLFGATLTGATGAGSGWAGATCQDGTLADDHADGCLGPVTVTTPSANPVISAGTAGTNGWYTSQVTVTWYWADSNAMAAAGCPASTSSTGQGTAVRIAAICTDAAGHAGTASLTEPIDTTPPVVTVIGVRNGAVYDLHDYPQFPQCQTTDALSGVAWHAATSFTSPPVNGTGHYGIAGVWTIICSGAKDKAGNVAPTVTPATWTVGYEFGGFYAPRVNSTLSHKAKAITVRMFLADGDDHPIARSEQAAWAARHAFRVTLTGAGIPAVTAACGWNAKGGYLQCSIPMPRKVQTGRAHPYRIAAQQNLGSGWLPIQRDAYSENPETIYLS